MSNIPYLTKASAIEEYLAKIPEIGVPEKVTQDYLPTIGLSSSSDRPLIPLFRFLGFLDASGKPTTLYGEYRDTDKAGAVLARALKESYVGLYATYPDAHTKDVEAVANYFRTTTKLGDRAVRAMVDTFKALCGKADFEALEEGEGERGKRLVEGERKKVRRSDVESEFGPSISINIQLTIPITDNEAIYDKLFSSLRRNLLTPSEEEK